MKTYQIKQNNKVIQTCIPEERAMETFLGVLNTGEDVKQTWHDINNPIPVECRGDRYQITEEENENLKCITITVSLSEKKREQHFNITHTDGMLPSEIIGILEIIKHFKISESHTNKNSPERELSDPHI